MRLRALAASVVLAACGPGPAPSAPAPAPSSFAPSAPPTPPGPDESGTSPRTEGAAVGEPITTPSEQGHLVIEPDGDRYWVVYRRDDAACDFVRLAAGRTEPVTLFTDGLGDFAETECETSIAVSADGATLFYLHGDEVRSVSIERPTEREVLARGERFPRELVVLQGQLVWLTVGGDLYEDDVTGLGAVRALELPHGAPRDLARGLTEPMHLRWSQDALVVDEGGEQAHERRVILTDTREPPPPR